MSLINRALPLFFALVFFALALPAVAADPWLTELYDRLHDSPVQRAFREKAPMPFGVVFLPWAGITEPEIRAQFRTMKRLGFHNLKQVQGSPEWPDARLMEIALEEDIIPFWYGKAGEEPVTPQLLARLGISPGSPQYEAKLWAHQKEVLRRQIPAVAASQNILHGEFPGFRHTPDPFLPKEDVALFQQWLRRNYKSADHLAQAWNEYEIGIDPKPFRTWEDADRAVADLASQANSLRGYGGEYSRVRDVLRFKAETHAAEIRAGSERFHQQFPLVPTRTGGEMGLFLPFAWRATQMEALADTQTNTGSFYPSIHFAWHFGEVNYEVTRPIYMQASFANDLFKGGWSATWESTGGPQQLTGAKGWDAREQASTPGFSVNEGTMTQLLLSYLAAGFKGAGLWTWNSREAGWEGGEYALLNRQREPSPRAIRAGQIAQAADRYRQELWKAHKEPLVGVLLNWDNDAMWAAVSLRGRDHFRDYPMQARVGVSRALIDANIPFEYVTVTDLEKGLGPRYKVICLPAAISLSDHVLGLLTAFATQGGRVVADSPAGDYDEHGKVLKTGAGSAFERLFGTELRDLQYSNNIPRTLHGQKLNGFISDLHATSANVQSTFQTGEPAVTENRIGKGSSVLLAWDASFAVFRPGNLALQAELIRNMLGTLESPYACLEVPVYRLAAPEADHYFLLNDGPARSVRLNSKAMRYKAAVDVVTGKNVLLGSPIALEANSGRWLRFAK